MTKDCPGHSGKGQRPLLVKLGCAPSNTSSSARVAALQGANEKGGVRQGLPPQEQLQPLKLLTGQSAAGLLATVTAVTCATECLLPNEVIINPRAVGTLRPFLSHFLLIGPG